MFEANCLKEQPADIVARVLEEQQKFTSATTCMALGACVASAPSSRFIISGEPSVSTTTGMKRCPSTAWTSCAMR